MRVVIVGPGALGSLLAARLFMFRGGHGEAGNDITALCLLDYRQERAAILQESGLLLEEGERKILCTPDVTVDQDVCADSDVLFFCVKSNAVPSALAGLKPHLSRRTLLLGMQNGISHLDALSSAGCTVGVGITSEGATLLRPGHVRHGGHGLTRLGLLAGHSPAGENILRKTASLLDAAGMKTVVTGNPLQHVWAKLFVNTGINALTALHGCRNGELLVLTPIRELMVQAVREAEKVARARGIPIDTDPVAATFAVCRQTADNISSMLQDVRQGKRTEIDAINGAVVDEAMKLGLSAPVNAELVRQVKELEASYVSGK